MKLDPRIQFLKDPIVIFCIVALLTLTAIYLYNEHPEKLPI
jgi:hypothetical protein